MKSYFIILLLLVLVGCSCEPPDLVIKGITEATGQGALKAGISHI